ncbi:hypothetical protein [Nonlabens sp.]|uniref:hypothetical protein n=1 Tax=Nonlabens sp. TaxID=1888209 RepID=UPI001BD163D9|nr:hypothetical protein [Nonlabens sp.]
MKLKKSTDKIVVPESGNDISIPKDFVAALTDYRPGFTVLKVLHIELEVEKQIPSYNEDSKETHLKGNVLTGVIVLVKR